MIRLLHYELVRNIQMITIGILPHFGCTNQELQPLLGCLLRSIVDGACRTSFQPVPRLWTDLTIASLLQQLFLAKFLRLTCHHRLFHSIDKPGNKWSYFGYLALWLVNTSPPRTLSLLIILLAYMVLQVWYRLLPWPKPWSKYQASFVETIISYPLLVNS